MPRKTPEQYQAALGRHVAEFCANTEREWRALQAGGMTIAAYQTATAGQWATFAEVENGFWRDGMVTNAPD